MDSPQSVVSPFKSSVIEPLKQNSDDSVQNSGNLAKEAEVQRKEAAIGKPDDYIGVLEVYVHRARDIHNICIYHKQDVYAKLCMTSDPEITVSTKIINGGGRNPVFDDNVQLNVKTVDASLKCEIFMMSRARNYLQDQLLGFALVPLSEVLIKNGKIKEEFMLSSSDLFHSPAGFVQLSLSYTGALPEVMAIPAMPAVLATDEAVQEAEIQKPLPCAFDKIEFPDPKILNEDQMMVSEYIGISCTTKDSKSSEGLITSEIEKQATSGTGASVVKCHSAATTDSAGAPKHDSPPSSVSTNGVLSPSIAASSDTTYATGLSKMPNQDHDSTKMDKKGGDGESDSSSGGAESEKNTKPVITVNIEPEHKVVQQDIVDMYMKSMQQFTESLAKMKLPLDIDGGPASSGSSTSDQKPQLSKNSGSRVFYGSRAFF